MENYESETGCMYGKHVSSDMLRLMRSPAKSQRMMVRKDQGALLKESTQLGSLGCVSQDSYPRKSIPREKRKSGIKTRRQILQGLLAPNKNSGKGPSRGSTMRPKKLLCINARGPKNRIRIM